MRGMGPLTSRVCIIESSPSSTATHSGTPLAGFDLETVKSKLLRAGIHPDTVRFEVLQRDALTSSLKEMPNLSVIVALGEPALSFLTTKKGLEKWQCSPLPCKLIPGVTVIPCFTMKRIKAQWNHHVFLELAFAKAKHFIDNTTHTAYNFQLNPPLEQTLHTLSELLKEPTLAVDLEYGNGQINTVGFAWSPHDAIAINVLPDRLSDTNYYTLWKAIAAVAESDSFKIAHNCPAEDMWLSKYGINLRNIHHDTMWAQKFLWPEFKKSLAMAGRFYTNRPYWKDTGKEEDTEEKKQWGHIRDWPKHYEYNCLDTTGTFEIYLNQRQDLEARGLLPLWNQHVAQFTGPLLEMCRNGLPVNTTTQEQLRTSMEAEVATLASQMSKEINHRSPKQKIQLLKEKGYKIPKKRGKGESADELSIKKLRLKHPEDNDLNLLLQIAKKEKALSSYIRASIHQDNRLRATLNGCGTETGRWASNKDPWNKGCNIQTFPSYAKKMLEWPEEANRIFIQMDLGQAESRYVAYDGADDDLIRMLEDPNEDVHSYVASHIFNCSMEQVIEEAKSGDKSKRQLGKKSGHGANYDMQERTFMDSCLKEMDLVISKSEAAHILSTYHKLFPGVRRRQRYAKEELRQKGYLTTPIGRKRYFYGRMDENTFREAYAFAPQSTIPDITNFLMLGLWEMRRKGAFNFSFHNQVHDSVVLSCEPEERHNIIQWATELDNWHPEIHLRAGRLRIPIDAEWGTNYGKLTEYN